ncbi:MAG TPA: right-handed parallel beta-helix repeat-containing protein [Pyrinomonadaceae bacterium]|nr:right-handed parallel beta-helix repeat-containing protein [Pyrinomonadaceae bacterium]
MRAETVSAPHAHNSGLSARVAARRARACAALLPLVLLAALAAPTALVTRPAAAQNSGAGALEVIPAGSLVIPMDNTQQASGTVFNLKAYGAVEAILWAGIPVKWVIAPGKAKDGLDFTATASRVYPTAQGAASRNFSGGPFVVHRDFAVPAKAAVSAFATANGVTVYETTADVTANVRHTITHRPKVAVFNDGGSADIHQRYLTAAGFTAGTHYDIIPAATLITVNATACFTIGTEPHFGASSPASDPQVNAVRQFVTSGGNFLAECEGVTTYENNPTYGRFMTTTGIDDGGGDNPISYLSPDLPYSQFVGAMADVGGSVRDFAPLAGGGYNASAEMHVRKAGSIRDTDGSPPAKATVARVAGPAVGGFVFYLGGHEYNTTAQGDINGVRMYLNAIFTPSARPSNCGLTLTPRTISGTVYEDTNGDSQLGDASPRANVSVRLYQDNNNSGVVDGGDTFLISGTTDASGQYSFQVAPQATGTNYLVAVNSKTVAPAAGLVAGRGDAWAEQTYGDDPTTAALDLGARFGGRAAGTSDNFNAADTAVGNNNYQHLARVDVTAGNVTNADFAFSFNAVTNTRGGDAADDDTSSATRTVQGSLRQFIQNANAVAGPNYMRFVPGVAANAGGATYWQVAVTTALGQVLDPDTTVDGTAYNSANGTSVRDTNTGSLGAGGTVGADALALSQVARPELEVLGTAAVAVGLDLQANNSTVRRLAVRGFGATPNNDGSANVRVGNNFTNALVEQNFLGVTANAAAFTTGAAASAGDNLRSVGADGGTVRNNLVGFSAGKGIQLGGTSTGWLVEGNEVRYNAVGNPGLDGLDIENGSGNCTVRGNLFAANEGAGVDMFSSTGGNTVENNTVTGNGIGSGASAVTAGVRVYGAGSVVRKNVITANFGAGVMVTSGATGNLITRNSISANGTVTNKGGAAASGQIGIDLLSAANSQTAGSPTYVTINDGGDADAGGNGLLNFPVLTSARIVGADLVLQGFAPAGADLELFVAAPDPLGFGEGQTYLLTLTEGSAADTDATAGAYTSPVNGLNVGAETTSRFNFTLPVPAGVAVDAVLTATATAGGSTSEFSGNVTVQNAPPEIKLEKDCVSPADCEQAEQSPGTELTYTITFTNVGGSPAQNLVLFDIVPFSVDTTAGVIVRSTDFKVGSMSFSPGDTGLTLPAAGIKHYSDAIPFPAPTPPWTPAAAYTPGGAPGTFDANVTYVSWQFTGSMPAGTSGSVSFTVRIR